MTEDLTCLNWGCLSNLGSVLCVYMQSLGAWLSGGIVSGSKSCAQFQMFIIQCSRMELIVLIWFMLGEYFDHSTDLEICHDRCQMILGTIGIYNHVTWHVAIFVCIMGLTYLPLDKMAAISQMIFSYAFSWMQSFVFWLKFNWTLFPKGLVNNIPVLVQIMAWHRIGNRLLSEPMLTRFTDINMQHLGETSLKFSVMAVTWGCCFLNTLCYLCGILDQNKMTAILQITFSNAFPPVKYLYFTKIFYNLVL